MLRSVSPPSHVVLVLGDAALDWVVRIPQLPAAGGNAWADPPRTTPGGTGANTAVALARLGVRARFCGWVGDDAPGRRLAADLDGEGVEIVLREPATGLATPVVIAFVDERGERTLVSCARGSAQTALRVDDVPEAAWRGVSWVHATGILLAEEPSRSAVPVLLAAARERGIPVSFDLNLRLDADRPATALRAAVTAAVAESDVVFASAGEAIAATGAPSAETAALALARRRGAVVRVGPAGALVADGGRVTRVPGFPADVVDLLGVGDAWDAGAIAALVSGGSLLEAARSGNAAAALAAGGTGARSSPARDAHVAVLQSG